MAKDDEETIIHITITFEDDESQDFQPSVLDVAAHNAVSTIHTYVMVFIFLIPLGWFISLFQ